MKVSINPCYGDPQIGNTADICVVGLETSPLVLYMYIKFHYFSFSVKTTDSPDLFFEYVMATIIIQVFLKV